MCAIPYRRSLGGNRELVLIMNIVSAFNEGTKVYSTIILAGLN